MTELKLIIRGLWHYRRLNALTMLGAALATMVLVGALLVGHSFRRGLRDMNLGRLGRVSWAVENRAGRFRADLADELGKALDCEAVPISISSGVAVGSNGRQVHKSSIIAVNAGFAGIASEFMVPTSNTVVVNRILADRLGLKVGDSLLLRIDKPGLAPRDTPLRTAGDSLASRRFRVTGIIDGGAGDFSLSVSSLPPANVFVNLADVDDMLDSPAGANTILLTAENLNSAGIESALSAVWELEDAGLRLVDGDLKSGRVFLPDAISAAAEKAGGEKILTYLVNGIRFGKLSTPYSFVSGYCPPGMDALSSNGIAVTGWLADDLGCRVGDELELSYFVLGENRGLREVGRRLRVENILPMTDGIVDGGLMPDLPGITDADDCSDWDSGLPLDLTLVRPKDEQYWRVFRGAPKAFVNPAAAVEMWGNRHGSATSLRFVDDAAACRIMSELTPSAAGFAVLPIREMALAAADNSVDFGVLFIGLGFFLMLAALLLTALLAGFSVQARSGEALLARALGFRRNAVFRWRLTEGMILAVLGGVLGLPLGVAYAWLLTTALGGVWRGAVGIGSVGIHVSPPCLLIGLGAGAAVSAVAIGFASIAGRKLAVSGGARLTAFHPVRSRKKFCAIIAFSCFAVLTVLLVAVDPRGGRQAAGVFLIAGSTSLCGLLALTGIFFRGWRLGRSLAIVGMVACGVFLVISVAANRAAPPSPREKSSGTGGYAFYGEFAIPVFAAVEDDDTLALSVSDGDDAGCLNINRAQRFRVIGVDAAKFAERGAFGFVNVADGVDEDNPWTALMDYDPAGPIPVVADEATIVWGMGKLVGDEFDLICGDGKRRRALLTGGLATSLFHGSLLIPAAEFKRFFPAGDGVGILLTDKDDAAGLSADFVKHGLELEATGSRLARFARVENTYLNIFLALGGLGVALGALGVAVVLLRDGLERRYELALRRVLGFRRREVAAGIAREYGLLLSLGLIVGMMAAAVAAAPVLVGRGAVVPWLTIALVLVLTAVNGWLWVAFAAAWATSFNPGAVLRGE